MRITINKESAVPLRDQLIEQIALQIASGTLKSKEKLPSIRALADRLGIHYSTITAAYNHLSDVGLLEIRQGSGVRVAMPPQAPETSNVSDLDSMCRDFLARASELGYSRLEVAAAVDRLRQTTPIRQLIAVDRNKDFHPLMLKELSPHFDLPIQVYTVEELKENPSLADDSLIITSLYHVFSFQEMVKDLTRLVVCNIEPARHELEEVKTMSQGKLLLLVSVSPTLLRMASKLVAAERGEDIAVKTLVSSDEEEIKYSVKYADLIICDSTCKDKIFQLQPKAKTLAFELYSKSTIDLIRDRIRKWG